MSGNVIKADFVWKFKTGDNIKYNIEILTYLYNQYNKDKNYLLLKPIIITNTTIIEAVLHDFCHRIKGSIREELSLPEKIIQSVRGKNLKDEFEKYIAQARSNDFFELSQTTFYTKLDNLRKIRNRVHIQNTNGHQPYDEKEVFTEPVKVLSEKLLEKTLKTLSEKYPRSHNYVGEFELPWDPYF